MKPESCSRTNSCTVHRVWERAQRQLRETLREATFADLLNEDCCVSPFEQVVMFSSLYSALMLILFRGKVTEEDVVY